MTYTNGSTLAVNVNDISLAGDDLGALRAVGRVIPPVHSAQRVPELRAGAVTEGFVLGHLQSSQSSPGIGLFHRPAW